MTPSPIPSAADAEALQSLKSVKPPSVRTIILSLLPSVLLNGVCVLVIYQLVKHYTSASNVNALLLSALPAVIGTTITLLRRRTLDVLGAFSLTNIAISLGLAFITGNIYFLLLRDSIATTLFSIICLVSLLFPKPLWYYVVRYFISSGKQERMAAYHVLWSYPAFRTYIRNLTILWGVTYLIEALTRVVLVFTLSITQFLAISPFIFYGITVLAVVLTFRYLQSLRKQYKQSNQQQFSS